MSKKEKSESFQKLLEEEKKKSEVYIEQYKYLKADFENYKKIAEKDKERIIKNANEQMMIDLLPILDDFEAALKNMRECEEKKGVEMIFNKLSKVLESKGLKKIDTLNKKFDPYYHEALLKENSEMEEGYILEEIQKGYMLNDKVLRHSKVKVSKRGDDHG